MIRAKSKVLQPLNIPAPQSKSAQTRYKARRRPHSPDRMRLRSMIISLTVALSACIPVSSSEEDTGPPRFPTSRDFPASVMQRAAFAAGVPEAWRISTLRTPERAEAPWRIVVITGTPSWSEYWAPTIARVGADREMIVVDRPGFALSEPQNAVTDIATQAQALTPLLNAAPGQKVALVGQSYGAPIAALMAAAHPDKVQSLTLVSSYFGERGPTARRLFGIGSIVSPFLRRDLKNSIQEVRGQQAQLPEAFVALGQVQAPVVFVHGSADTFVTAPSVRAVAERYEAQFIDIPNGDHFLNACCVDEMLAAIERAILLADAREAAP